MTEQAGNGPENQPQTPEQGLVVSGVTRFVKGWRGMRVGQLEDSITELTKAIDQVDPALEVDENTAKYARLKGGVMAVEEPTPSTPEADREAIRRDWVIKTSHESKTDKVAKDGTIAKALRPTTRKQQKTKVKVERAEARAVRPSGVVSDLHRIYDLPDKAAIDALPKIPDRRPHRGNTDARALVDESLRRAKLLKDQPARGPEPKLRLGTEEHRQATSDQRLRKGVTARRSEPRRLLKAEKTLISQEKLVAKQVGRVEKVASGNEARRVKLEKEIEKKQARAERIKSGKGKLGNSAIKVATKRDRSVKVDRAGRTFVALQATEAVSKRAKSLAESLRDNLDSKYSPDSLTKTKRVTKAINKVGLSTARSVARATERSIPRLEEKLVHRTAKFSSPVLTRREISSTREETGRESPLLMDEGTFGTMDNLVRAVIEDATQRAGRELRADEIDATTNAAEWAAAGEVARRILRISADDDEALNGGDLSELRAKLLFSYDFTKRKHSSE